MASIFNTGLIPTFTKEQQKTRRAAWKPNSVALKMKQSGSAVTVYRSPERQAEWEAEQNAIAAEKLARKMAGIEKRRATLAAKKSSKKA